MRRKTGLVSKSLRIQKMATSLLSTTSHGKHRFTLRPCYVKQGIGRVTPSKSKSSIIRSSICTCSKLTRSTRANLKRTRMLKSLTRSPRSVRRTRGVKVKSQERSEEDTSSIVVGLLIVCGIAFVSGCGGFCAGVAFMLWRMN